MKCFLIGVGVSRDYVDTSGGSQLVNRSDKVGELNNGQAKHRPHGISYRAAQIGAA
jgi:hypothetical protein